ncbi:MAG: hypothetical protein MHM6MM_002279 [Cercozoa sp. M6MM]
MPPRRRRAAEKAKPSVPTSQSPERDVSEVAAKLRETARTLQQQLEGERSALVTFEAERDRALELWTLERDRSATLLEEVRNSLHELRDSQMADEMALDELKCGVREEEREKERTLAQRCEKAVLRLFNRAREHDLLSAETARDTEVVRASATRTTIDSLRVEWRLRFEQARALHAIRGEAMQRQRALIARHAERCADLRAACDEQRREIVLQVETEKQHRVRDLLDSHKRSLLDMKHYFTDVTHSNLELIKSLKNDVAEAQARCATKDRQLRRAIRKNRSLSEPLRNFIESVKLMEEKQTDYIQLRAQLKVATARSETLNGKAETLRWLNEVLTQQGDEVRSSLERQETALSKHVLEKQRKEGLEHLILERRVSQISNELETQDLLLREVVERLVLNWRDEEQSRKPQEDVVGEQPADEFEQQLTGPPPELFEKLGKRLCEAVLSARRFKEICTVKEEKITALTHTICAMKDRYRTACRLLEDTMQEHHLTYEMIGFRPTEEKALNRL